jgi:DNA-binding CsgD family transcriptional regulator
MQAFDLLGIGWLVCDSAGRLLGSNPLASRILSSRAGLRLSILEDVPDATAQSKRLLADAVKRAIEAVPIENENPGAVCFVTERGAGKRALTVMVRRVGTNSASESSSRPVALAFILDPQWSSGTADSELRKIYGFTEREAALAAMLMNGDSVQDCCKQMQMKRSTARSHLKRMFKKMRVRRQSEMVSVLLKTVGMVAFRRQERNLCFLLSKDLSSIQ